MCSGELLLCQEGVSNKDVKGWCTMVAGLQECSLEVLLWSLAHTFVGMNACPVYCHAWHVHVQVSAASTRRSYHNSWRLL
jgi:hypothetical protein